VTRVPAANDQERVQVEVVLHVGGELGDLEAAGGLVAERVQGDEDGGHQDHRQQCHQPLEAPALLLTPGVGQLRVGGELHLLSLVVRERVSDCLGSNPGGLPGRRLHNLGRLRLRSLGSLLHLGGGLGVSLVFSSIVSRVLRGGRSGDLSWDLLGLLLSAG